VSTKRSKSSKSPDRNKPASSEIAAPFAAAIEEGLIQQLRSASAEGRSLTQLKETLRIDGSKVQPPALEAALAALETHGLAVCWARRWYWVAATDWQVGRIGRGLEEGVVEVRQLDPLAQPYKARQSDLKSARRGDLVLVKLLPDDSGRRKGSPGARGRKSQDQSVAVVKVLAHRSPTLVGTVREDRDGEALFVPFEDSLGGDLKIVQGTDDASGHDLLADQRDRRGRIPPGLYFVARLVEGDTGEDGGKAEAETRTVAGDRGRRGRSGKRTASRGSGREKRSRRDESGPPVRLVEFLGHESTPGVDIDTVLRHFEIPDAFPDEVLEQAATLPSNPDVKVFEPAQRGGKEKTSGARRDLRSLVTVTIDGATAKDFDDAISVEHRKGGLLRLGVHVADVAEYVTENSALDREALQRGTSVYLPDRVVPMLPEKLSNGLCSLNPRVPRFAMSVLLDIDRRGEVAAVEFCESLIQSDARLTYREVTDWLAREDNAGELGEPEVEKLLSDAREVGKRLLAARERRGALDFGFPVNKVIVDREGRPTGVEAEHRTMSHRMIEEFMIAANRAVARELDGAMFDNRPLAAIYRRHDPPGLSRIHELFERLESLDGDLLDGADVSELVAAIVESPKPLQKLQERVAGDPLEPLIASLILRSLARAIYHPKNSGHFALGLDHYCHFTSPIRRYPDLIVHRQLKQLLHRETPLRLSPDRLYSLADRCSMAEQRAEDAERRLTAWKKVRLLEGRVGEEFVGHVTGVLPFGAFVQLDEYLVDGLIPISRLGDDYFVFDSAEVCLRGDNTGQSIRLADEVTVRLVAIQYERRGLLFERVATAERSDGGGRRGKRSRGGSNRSGTASEPKRPGKGRKKRDPGRRRS
jgi:ribonuclease R